jgi:uncharacterized membrane protein HdeD (DUF308 family)
MKKNVGRTDRIIRIVVGIVLVVLGFVVVFPSDWLAWVVVILGAILLITGILGFCPLYLLLKMNTNK